MLGPIKGKDKPSITYTGKIDCNTESSYKKFQACLITYNKVVRVFVSMPWGYYGAAMLSARAAIRDVV